jgi:uncharacterized protein (TIGR03067 family)
VAGYDAQVRFKLSVSRSGPTMSRWTILCVALGLIAAADSPADAGKKELDALQGKWSMAGLEVNGEKVPPEKFPSSRLEITGERYIVNTGRSSHEMRIKVDPTKSPKTIDMTFQDGDNKGDTAEGIYKVEGDTLTICRPRLPPHERPTEFVTKPGTDRFIVTWKREK